jgi:hypothetical protein
MYNQLIKFMTDYDLQSSQALSLMVEQITQDLKFLPGFQNLREQQEGLKQRFTFASGSEVRKDQKAKPGSLWFNYSLGKYELFFEGFYPILDFSLKDEIKSGLLRQSLKIIGFKIWEVEDKRLARSISNLAISHSSDGIVWKREPEVIAAADCYLLERVKISIARVIVTNDMLMYIQVHQNRSVRRH